MTVALSIALIVLGLGQLFTAFVLWIYWRKPKWTISNLGCHKVPRLLNEDQ